VLAHRMPTDHLAPGSGPLRWSVQIPPGIDIASPGPIDGERPCVTGGILALRT